jgi:hypothetical protein
MSEWTIRVLMIFGVRCCPSGISKPVETGGDRVRVRRLAVLRAEQQPVILVVHTSDSTLSVEHGHMGARHAERMRSSVIVRRLPSPSTTLPSRRRGLNRR